MGKNYRFRLSDMIPNAWFYKLTDMSKTTSQNPNKKLPFPSLKHNKEPANFYHTSPNCNIPTSFDSSRNSSEKKPGRRPTVYVPSQSIISPSTVSGDFHVFQEPVKPGNLLHFQSSFLSPDTAPTFDPAFLDDSRALPGFHDPGNCKLITSSATDIIIDVNEESHFNMVSQPKLAPILTKPKPQNSLGNRNHLSSQFKKTALEAPKKSTTPESTRKSVSRSGGGVRIRAKKAKAKTLARKSLKWERKPEKFHTERLAIVKASFDPERDFRESMMEMIVENNIKASKELEELLACYLSLNSNRYHTIIIKAFEQIWFAFSIDQQPLQFSA